MMNIMYRHIMYRGKNTSVPTVETRRGTSLHYVSGHVVHITCRGLSRQTLRVGVCRVKHYVSGFVVSNIVVSGHVVSNITCRGLLRQTLSCRGLSYWYLSETTNKGQHYNITTTLQKGNNQQPRANKADPFEAHCSLFSVFFPASNPQAAIISSPREARIVVIIPCDVR